jgi:hypothetical protein
MAVNPLEELANAVQQALKEGYTRYVIDDENMGDVLQPFGTRLDHVAEDPDKDEGVEMFVPADHPQAEKVFVIRVTG